MKILSLLLLTLCVLSKPSVLVVLDSWSIKDTHSLWFSKLKEKYDLTIKFAEEKNIKLMNFDESNYDHVMIIAPSVSIADSNINEEALLEFFDNGHSILMMGDTLMKKYQRNFVKNFGIDVFPQDNILGDNN